MYNIFVVEDELLIRQSIRNIVESMAGPYVFCGEASDGEMALSMMQDMMPDIVLTDIRMPFLDGFELIRHLKAMMPWVKVIIISGYDDFEYARRAIGLGVDLYLLKPVRAAELTEAVIRLAAQLESERKRVSAPQAFDPDEVQSVMRQHFIQQLTHGTADTASLLEAARRLQLDIVRPVYRAAVFSLDSDPADPAVLRSAVVEVLERTGSELYFFGDAARVTVLFSGNDAEDVTESIYRFTAILRHELMTLCPCVTVVIGSEARRLSEVSDSCRTAEDILRKTGVISAGRVIDANDTAQLLTEIVEYGGPFDEKFQQRLRLAAEEDIPALADSAFSGGEGDPYGSMLMRYNALIDLLRLGVKLVAETAPAASREDITAKLSSAFDIFSASGSYASFRKTAEALMLRVVRMRRETTSDLRYTYVTGRAEQYIRENFCDPNISLISTAKHVAMSPAHFSTVFSQAAGKTFITYLTELRMEKAKQLLQTTDLKLSDVAMAIGYNEPNYFSHVFRKTVGMPPKDWRNAHGRKE